MQCKFASVQLRARPCACNPRATALQCNLSLCAFAAASAAARLAQLQQTFAMQIVFAGGATCAAPHTSGASCCSTNCVPPANTQFAAQRIAAAAPQFAARANAHCAICRLSRAEDSHVYVRLQGRMDLNRRASRVRPAKVNGWFWTWRASVPR